MSTSTQSGKVASVIKELKIGDSGAFGWSYIIWRLLQHGQERLFRWNKFRKVFKRLIRWQSGHDHCCSLNTLVNEKLVLMRPHVTLDELIIIKCAQFHDQPEGVRLIDTPAPLKTDQDDLNEYLVFEEMYKPFGPEIWQEFQRCYLLQTCLKNPKCFPLDAREVMTELAEKKRNEALFFSAMEKVDYLYYAYECGVERNFWSITAEVAFHQFQEIDDLAEQLPGFKQAVWNGNLRHYIWYRSKYGEKIKKRVVV